MISLGRESQIVTVPTFCVGGWVGRCYRGFDTRLLRFGTVWYPTVEWVGGRAAMGGWQVENLRVTI
jgi:hypothetical protein